MAKPELRVVTASDRHRAEMIVFCTKALVASLKRFAKGDASKTIYSLLPAELEIVADNVVSAYVQFTYRADPLDDSALLPNIFT